ncbi:RNA polymerase sigma-H factor [Candidatus Entotheonellaceae bacterium PAL068K]
MQEPQPDITDYRLIQRVQAGDTEAFEILFTRYNVRIYGQAVHLLDNEAEAEEVMQEVFLTLYEKARTFRGDAALSTWLYRVTANATLSRLRRRTQRQEISMDDYRPQFQDDGHHLMWPVVDWSQNIEHHVAQEEVRRLLREAIEDLRPVDKLVVVLSGLEGLSNREVGDVLALSVSAVKARLHRARLCLRGKLAAALAPSAS